MDSLVGAYTIAVDHEYINEPVEVIEHSEVVQYVVEEAQIVEEPDPEPEQQVYDSDEYTQTGRKRLWSKPAVKLMLCLIEDILPDVGTTNKMPTKSEMYKYVAKEMAKEGYSFTGPQIENKFRGIEKNYKRKQIKLGIIEPETVTSKSSSIRKKRRVESTPDKLEEEEPKSDPEVVWMCEPEASNQYQSDFKAELNTSSRANSEPRLDQLERTTEGDFPSTALNNKSTSSTIHQLKMFAKMAAERKRYHHKVIAYLKEKDQRGRKREEREERKLELLESLLGQKT